MQLFYLKTMKITHSPWSCNVDPRVIQFNESSPVLDACQKVAGRVIDISGEKKAAGIQIVIMASDDPDASAGSQSYHPIFSAQTDRGGYFFGRVDNRTHERAYGLIAGLEGTPIPITQDDKKIPRDLILVADLSDLPGEALSGGGTPMLPDADDLVRSSSFSQDLGGKCVDFTIPNRTLEELSFYHTVWTTEPEIKGLTITAKESKYIIDELQTISDELFTIFGRLNNSFRMLSVIPYTVDEEKTASEMDRELRIKSAPTAFPASPVLPEGVFRNSAAQIKHTGPFASRQRDQLQFSGQNVVEQARRKAKLQELHQQLAAAYCGKYGVQEAKTYCETLSARNALNYATLESLLGHIKKYAGFFEPGSKLGNHFEEFVSELGELLQQPFADSGLINVMKTRAVKLIQEVDTATNESQNQEELLGYLRRLVAELSQVGEKGVYNFEPCPSTEKTKTMGIRFLMHQFEDMKNVLHNKAVFSLGEILMIRSNYDLFITSISAFLNLLEQFHSFYASSTSLMVGFTRRLLLKLPGVTTSKNSGLSP